MRSMNFFHFSWKSSCIGCITRSALKHSSHYFDHIRSNKNIRRVCEVRMKFGFQISVVTQKYIIIILRWRFPFDISNTCDIYFLIYLIFPDSKYFLQSVLLKTNKKMSNQIMGKMKNKKMNNFCKIKLISTIG